MTINLRAVLRSSISFTLTMIFTCGLGLLIWMIDSVLGWNILPDFLDIYVELILGVFSAMTGLSILAAVICLLGIIGEWIAQKANYKKAVFGAKTRKKVLVASLFSVLLLCSFYFIDRYKKDNLEASRQLKKNEIYAQQSSDLDSSLSANIELAAPLILNLLNEKEKRQKELAATISSLSASLPHHPKVEIMIKDKEPYKYSIISMKYGVSDTAIFIRRLFSLPTTEENKIAEQIFKESSTNEGFGEGTFFDAHRPHAWKLLRKNSKNQGIIMVKAAAVSL